MPEIVPVFPSLDKDSCKDLDETPPRRVVMWRSCALVSWAACKTIAWVDRCCHRSCHPCHTLRHWRGQRSCSLHRSPPSPPECCCPAGDSYETLYNITGSQFFSLYIHSHLGPVVDILPCLPVPQERLFLYPLMKHKPMSNVEQTSNSDVNNLI